VALASVVFAMFKFYLIHNEGEEARAKRNKSIQTRLRLVFLKCGVREFHHRYQKNSYNNQNYACSHQQPVGLSPIVAENQTVTIQSTINKLVNLKQQNHRNEKHSIA
jgi:hypothetical protein